MSNSIRLFGLAPYDRIVLITMIEILSTKTNRQWRVVGAGCSPVDIAIIDVDRITDAHEIQRLAEQADYVVTLGRRKVHKDYIPLPKPLRTAQLLKSLSAVALAQNSSGRLMSSQLKSYS